MDVVGDPDAQDVSPHRDPDRVDADSTVDGEPMTATHIRPLQTTLGGDLYKLDPPFGPEEDEFVRVEPMEHNHLYAIYPSNCDGRWITHEILAKGSTVQESFFNLGYRIKR